MIFVSYSRRNRSLVQPLVRLLRASGQDVFIDQENLDYGTNWREQGREAIARSSRFLLFWSRDASRSDFVEEEWRAALESSSISIVPIILDRTRLPPELSHLHGTDELQGIANKVGLFSRLTRVLAIMVPIVLVVLLAVPFYRSVVEEPQRAGESEDEIVLRGSDQKIPSDRDLSPLRQAIHTPLIITAALITLLPLVSYLFMTRYRRRLGRELTTDA